MTPLKRFFGLLSQDKKDLVYLYVYSSFQGIISLSLPLGIQAIMGLVLAGRLSSSWVILTVLVTLGVIVAGGFQLMQLYIVEIIQRRLFTRTAFDFAYRIPLFRLSTLKNYYPPELVNRFFDTIGLQKSLPKILLDFSSSLLQIIVGLILLSLYHPVFIGFSFFLLLILSAIIWFYYTRGLQTSLKESDAKYEMAHWLVELARSIKTFKLVNNDLNLRKVDNINLKYLSARHQHFRILVLQYMSIVGLKTLVTAGLLITGAVLLLENSITIGQFVASEIIIILVLNSSEKMIVSLEYMYDLLTSVEKLGKVTDIELDKAVVDGYHINTKESFALSVKNLQIKGNKGDVILSQPLSFELLPGENMAVLGAPGSGKSSLIKVLATVNDNFTGHINFNDMPLNSLCKNTLRNSFGVVFDQFDYFYGSVYENISLGRQDISLGDVVTLCKELGLSKVIESFENGYNHVIVNSDFSFSATDKVKIMIARALIHKPKILFIEDVFTTLPDRERNEVLTFLKQKCEQVTSVWITNNELILSKMDKTITL